MVMIRRIFRFCKFVYFCVRSYLKFYSRERERIVIGREKRRFYADN